MITATVATFRERLPELSRFDDDVVARAIEEATFLHDVNPLATLLAAAHLLVVAELGDDFFGVISGPTVSQSRSTSNTAGPLSTSTTNSSTSVSQVDIGDRDAYFVLTSYGQRFLQLERRSQQVTLSARVVG